MMPLRDGDHIGWQAEISMECGTVRALDAVRRPWATRGGEAQVVLGMPVAGGEYWHAGLNGLFEPTIEDRDDAVPLLNRKRSAWAEVLLHVHKNECIARAQMLRLSHANLHPNSSSRSGPSSRYHI